jgi:hypothetical protein
MDACWIYCVAWLFSGVVLSGMAVFSLPSPTVLAALALGAWGLTALLADKTTLPVGVVRALVGVVGVLASVAVTAAANPRGNGGSLGAWLSAGGYDVLVLVGVWGVGTYRATQRPDFDMAYRIFRLGLIAVVTASFLASLLARDIRAIWEGVGGVALWFVAWSLCALALGNREALRREAGEASTRFWGVLLAGSLACVFFVATASGAFALGGVFGVLQQLVGVVVLAVLTGVYWLVYGLFWLMSLGRLPLKKISREPTPTPTPAPNPVDESSRWLEKIRRDLGDAAPLDISPELQALLTVLTAALMVALVAWLVSRVVGRTRRDEVKETMEERESLGPSWQLLCGQVRAWIGYLLGRFLGGAQVQVAEGREDDLAVLEGKAEWMGTLSVRQIYARLQWTAGQMGYPRAPQQTPVEYLGVLSMAMPDLRGEFSRITAAYVEARYGGSPVSGQAVAAATEAWRRAEAELLLMGGA